MLKSLIPERPWHNPCRNLERGPKPQNNRQSRFCLQLAMGRAAPAIVRQRRSRPERNHQGVSGLHVCRVYCSGFRLRGYRLRVQGLGSPISGLACLCTLEALDSTQRHEQTYWYEHMSVPILRRLHPLRHTITSDFCNLVTSFAPQHVHCIGLDTVG